MCELIYSIVLTHTYVLIVRLHSIYVRIIYYMHAQVRSAVVGVRTRHAAHSRHVSEFGRKSRRTTAGIKS